MKDTKLVKILNEMKQINEEPANRKYMPKNINYRQVFGGDDGTVVKSTKRLSQVAADMDTISGVVDNELRDGLLKVLKTVEDKIRSLKTDTKSI